ncbi:Fumarylacetoacetase, C-terminal [Kalmanozyma brasiliensis GHG001]|uniref:Fumarylacetoacetase, C-terminal n=1 Tax=Kalmanozyma brasiliensis (strain GHG001) TaxID=1365824 RepID=UPI001CE9E590|nr:Fumarylacetoacetase, C-terminal [Kalmanozyma brasiliensis GHG001]EST06756.2 Fumarylacetoacetase, C-terminal [Kalmanozyma brasiliensis GHG001]
MMKDYWTWDLAELDWCDEDPDKDDEGLAISELLPIFLEELMCGQPVFMPDRVYCVGVNYRSFAAAAGLEIPEKPTAILRPTTAIDYHGEDIIVPEDFATEDVDYEAHLAVVIRHDCKNVSPEDAMDQVFGILAATHVVLRSSPGESFDGCCTLGPVIVNANALQDEDWGNIQIEGELNGEIVQRGFVRDMAFSIPQLISTLSRRSTLKAGTIILTGTPAGTGWYREPRRMLKDGDKFRVWVSHGVGSLVNTIRFEE